MPNYNPETGIRYGTIYLSHLDSDVANDLWMNGENVSETQAYAELKSEIERDADGIEEEVAIAIAESDHALLSSERFVDNEIEAAYLRLGYDDRDDYIDTRLERESENIQIDEPIIEGTCEGVRYAISHLGGAPLLWVFESPIISTARLCSPCVPNAGDLDSLDDDGYECYGIPSTWRRAE
jgi:hypothetical protein